MKVLRVFNLVTLTALLFGLTNCQVGDSINPDNNDVEFSLALQVNPDWSHLNGGGHNFILREARKDSITENLLDFTINRASEWFIKNDIDPIDTAFYPLFDSLSILCASSSDTSATKVLDNVLLAFPLPLDSLPDTWEDALINFASAMDAGSQVLHQYISNFKTKDESLSQVLLASLAVYDSSSAFWTYDTNYAVPFNKILISDALGAAAGGLLVGIVEHNHGEIDWGDVFWGAVFTGALSSYQMML